MDDLVALLTTLGEVALDGVGVGPAALSSGTIQFPHKGCLDSVATPTAF